jgi:hypothetical protein
VNHKEDPIIAGACSNFAVPIFKTADIISIVTVKLLIIVAIILIVTD